MCPTHVKIKNSWVHEFMKTTLSGRPRWNLIFRLLRTITVSYGNTICRINTKNPRFPIVNPVKTNDTTIFELTPRIVLNQVSGFRRGQIPFSFHQRLMSMTSHFLWVYDIEFLIGTNRFRCCLCPQFDNVPFYGRLFKGRQSVLYILPFGMRRGFPVTRGT